MGTRVRAERISKHFTNRAMQSIGYYLFDKCGNCVYRIPCIVEGALKTGGHPAPLQKIITDLSNGCIEHKNYKWHGIIPKNVAKLARSECKGCTKLNICVGNICTHVEMKDKEQIQKVFNQIDKCTKCDHLEDCVQTYIDEFKISSYKIMLMFFLQRFRRCAADKMQTVSCDIDKNKTTPQFINIRTAIDDTSSNVGDKSGEK